MSRSAPRSQPPAAWSSRWEALAQGVGLDPTAAVILALSGGADSVFLLHALAAAHAGRASRHGRGPERVLCVHVDHGLRGAESRADADFCRRLCSTLGVEFELRRAELDPDSPSLEAHAREARYAELFAVARAEGLTTILTGHHEDDALETLLLRLLRGSDLAGLGTLPARTTWHAGTRPRARATSAPRPSAERSRGCRHGELSSAPASSPPIQVVRPLTHLRREEVRCVLADWGLEWREDSSNGDTRFTRNKIRHELFPWLRSVAGSDALDSLRDFAQAVDSLEDELARRTAHLAWHERSSTAHGDPRDLQDPEPGPLAQCPWIARRDLARLPEALRRRALWRLIVEGTGRAPGRALLDLLLGDLRTARCTRRSLPGRFALQLRSDALLLIRPPELASPSPGAGQAGQAGQQEHAGQRTFPFGEPAEPAVATQALPLPGTIDLPDGRQLTAEIVIAAEGAPIPRDPRAVELDAEGLREPLVVRWSRPGDRFHPLGAPGSKPLRRFLADAGVPREERDRVPLVFSGGELLWAAGVRPCETHRVRGTTTRRVRLMLRDPDVLPA